MPASVGITGATGVLGRRITDALTRSGGMPNAFVGDVRDRDQVDAWIRGNDFATVIHSAAVVPVAKVRSDPGTAISVNSAGTANLAASCQAADKRLVYISTAHVYAPTSGTLSESGRVAPASLYGLTKLQGEEWCRRLAEESLILRVFSFFDERQPEDFAVPSLRRKIATAEPNARLPVHGLSSRRDLASAEWLADLITRLLRSEATGAVNCGTGIGTTIAQVAEVLKRARGRMDIELVAADSSPPDSLVADIGRLRELVPDLRPFDLTESLAEYAHGCPG